MQEECHWSDDDCTKRRWNDGGSSTVSGVTTHRGRRSLTDVMEDSHWSGA